MTADLGLPMRNRWAVDWDEVPVSELGAFRARVVAAVRQGARIVLLFGMPEEAARTWRSGPTTRAASSAS